MEKRTSKVVVLLNNGVQLTFRKGDSVTINGVENRYEELAIRIMARFEDEMVEIGHHSPNLNLDATYYIPRKIITWAYTEEVDEIEKK